MMVTKTYWPALLVITLLATAPSVALADEAEEIPAEDTGDEVASDEATGPEEDEPDSAADEAETDAVDPSEDGEEADAEPGDENDELSEEDEVESTTPQGEEPDDVEADDEPGEAPTATTEGSIPLDVEDAESDDAPEDPVTTTVDSTPLDDPEVEGDDTRRVPVEDDDYDAPAAGIAAIHADPVTNIQVMGNLEEGDRWSLAIGGYMRTAFTWIESDPTYDFFGRNDGFQILDARLITRAEMDSGLGAIFSLDAGSRLTRTDPDSPVEELAMRMADAYVYYSPLDFLQLNVGQFKAPFDAEDLLSSADLLFVHRSVANRGVRGTEGFNVPGMSQGRQIGLQARGAVPLSDDFQDGPAISYALAAANGNGPNRSMNENDRLAYYGRAAFHLGDMIAVGGAAFHNDRTFGDPPDQVDRTTWGWTADVQANFADFTLFTNIVSETRSVPDIEQDPETTGLGFQVQVAYEEPTFGLQPAYRFAFYDPTFSHGGDDEDDFFEHDAQFHHTIGLNYNAREYPLRLMANYTLIFHEEEGRPLDNDRLDLLLQLQW